MNIKTTSQAIEATLTTASKSRYVNESARVNRPRSLDAGAVAEILTETCELMRDAGETGIYHLAIRGGNASGNKWSQRADVVSVELSLDIDNNIEVVSYDASMGAAASPDQRLETLHGPTGRSI